MSKGKNINTVLLTPKNIDEPDGEFYGFYMTEAKI